MDFYWIYLLNLCDRVKVNSLNFCGKKFVLKRMPQLLTLQIKQQPHMKKDKK
jgi:hypothetical protein